MTRRPFEGAAPTPPKDLARDFAAIAASGYRGWVAWFDDGGQDWAQIYEAAVPNRKLIQVHREHRDQAAERQIRLPDRNIMDWKDLRRDRGLMARIQVLVLFGWHGRYSEQPLAVIQRGTPNAWFLQFKRRAITVATMGGGDSKDVQDPGLNRTPLISQTIGYWDTKLQTTTLVECGPNGRKELHAGHPCWPKPHGFGLRPDMCGLTPGEVPPSPASGIIIPPTILSVPGG